MRFSIVVNVPLLFLLSSFLPNGYSLSSSSSSASASTSTLLRTKGHYNNNNKNDGRKLQSDTLLGGFLDSLTNGTTISTGDNKTDDLINGIINNITGTDGALNDTSIGGLVDGFLGNLTNVTDLLGNLTNSSGFIDDILANLTNSSTFPPSYLNDIIDNITDTFLNFTNGIDLNGTITNATDILNDLLNATNTTEIWDEIESNLDNNTTILDIPDNFFEDLINQYNNTSDKPNATEILASLLNATNTTDLWNDIKANLSNYITKNPSAPTPSSPTEPSAPVSSPTTTTDGGTSPTTTSAPASAPSSNNSTGGGISAAITTSGYRSLIYSIGIITMTSSIFTVIA